MNELITKTRGPKLSNGRTNGWKKKKSKKRGISAQVNKIEKIKMLQRKNKGIDEQVNEGITELTNKGKKYEEKK